MQRADLLPNLGNGSDRKKKILELEIRKCVAEKEVHMEPLQLNTLHSFKGDKIHKGRKVEKEQREQIM
jgi:hypothetical protein